MSSTRTDGGASVFAGRAEDCLSFAADLVLSAIWVSALDGSNALQVTGFDGVDITVAALDAGRKTPRVHCDSRKETTEIYVVDAGGRSVEAPHRQQAGKTAFRIGRLMGDGFTSGRSEAAARRSGRSAPMAERLFK